MGGEKIIIWKSLETLYIFAPQDDPANVQKVLDDIWNKQEINQFGEASTHSIFCHENMMKNSALWSTIILGLPGWVLCLTLYGCSI